MPRVCVKGGRKGKPATWQCDRCTAITKKGTRCSICTCKTGPYCFIHLKYQKGLQVKPSRIPGAGMGLYTTVNRAPNSYIEDYTGPRLTKKQLDVLYPGDTLASYAWEHVPTKRYIDPVNSNSGAARYANTCDAPARAKRHCRNNLIAKSGKKAVKFYTCNRPIRAGEELYVSYGAGGYSLDGGDPLLSYPCN